MRSFLTALATSLLAVSATAEVRLAARFAADSAPHHKLAARDILDPTLVCGAGFVDCKNGFCCSAGEVCQTVRDVPICQVNNSTGTNYDAALPYDGASLAAAQTALSNIIAYYASQSTTAAPSSTPVPAYTTKSYNSTTNAPYSTGQYTTHYPNATLSSTGGSPPTSSPTPSGNAAASGRMVRGSEGIMASLGVFGTSALVGAIGMRFLLW